MLSIASASSRDRIEVTDGRPLKRRRVTRACDSCRVLKAKCDGRRPICGRCSGYGHTCGWTAASSTRRLALAEERPHQFDLLGSKEEVERLRHAIRQYDSLVRGVRDGLPDNYRKAVDVGLSTIQGTVGSPGESGLTETSGQPSPTEDDGVSDDMTARSAPHRFLGEASDIAFFRSMKEALTLPSHLEHSSPDQVDSYEQDSGQIPSDLDEAPPLLPPRATADRLLEIYFSTIHIAYPFVWEPAFRRKYETFWKSESLGKFRGPWLSILLTVLAIGACYETIVGVPRDKPELRSHHAWFDQAVAITQVHDAEQDVDHIYALLVQCFYLLATSQTDRCWITLGKAVRGSQSIGLHTEDVGRSLSDDTERAVMFEIRSRLWYSLYVLDRLLSLQLGRPPAIHDRDFKVGHPFKRGDLAGQSGSYVVARGMDVDPALSFGEYFLAMIRFSGIIGRVFSLLYGPNRTENAATTLSTIQDLDHDLLQWKIELPRNLRFDLAHTFDNSTVFKRQRNMLAIKFYHLRALIHRPFLSPARLLKSCADPEAFYQTEKPRILQSKKKCVASAQSTARLLHDIANKEQLVCGFPWWQMIPCLICATSILLVAGLCVGQDGDDVDDIDWHAVDEDAEACLTVFRELSINSNAARLAESMMQGLKETRRRSRTRTSSHTGEMLLPADNAPFIRIPSTSPSTLFPTGGMITATSALDPMFQRSPFDLSEPVVWSSQFVNASYHPFLGQPAPDFEDL